jgi:WD40 repeat protein/DNA-binding SARP family transcriptional activator
MAEFRILGPLEVVERDRALALGGRQQRAVLVVLVLHRGELVSTERVIDELWGERAPASAAKTVQGYVSHLRKVLGGGVIVTEGRGYRLAVAPGQVDAGRFELLSAEGRRALSEGDPVRARERLCSALGLWRGEPLAEFAYEPFAQAAVARLREARLLALEDRIDADLAAGSDGELIGELESLVAVNPLQERLRGQLMLALYRAGRQADALAVYRQTSDLFREELALDPSPWLQKLERAILEHDASLVGATPARAGRAARPDVCPFKGLAFFDRADAEYFFGRERLVSDLLARLVESTLVGMLGPSGIGKSSLLRAGLLPALSAGALPGSASWRQLLLRPGEHPCAELERVLDGERLAGVVGRLSPGERIVVAVDQLEELFTVCRLAEERASFLEQLVAAARDGDRRALVAVSLRADFYGRLAPYPAFAELLSGSHVLVGPMDDDELARAIEQPAALAGLEVERTLVDALVAHVAGEPGGLPLLSTTLLELWRTRDGRALRFDSYRTSGGVRGAVARLAEATYTRLDEGGRRIARSVMLRLAGGEDGTLVGRRVPLAELERLDGAQRVVATLTDARLLTVTDGEVELSHEALLREWPRYRTWLEDDRAGRRLLTHLTSSAREWDSRGRDPGELYRGARLARALEWAAEHDDQLSIPERRFLDASRRHAARDERRRHGVLFGVGLLLLAAAIAGAIAVLQKRHATAEARVALARQLGAEALTEPRLDLAMLLAREAVNLDRSPQTEGTLLATLQRSPAVIGTLALPVNASSEQMAVSPNGHTLAVGSYSFGPSPGSLRLYDLRTHAAGPTVADFVGPGPPPAYSSDGSLLVYPSFSRVTGAPVLVTRDAHTLALRATLAFERSQSDAFPMSVLIGPDGRTVYCAYSIPTASGNPGAAYLGRWSLPSGRRLSSARVGYGLPLASGLVDAGARLIIVWAGSVTTFNTQSLRRVRTVPITRTATPGSAAISPDGRTVVIGSHPGRVSFIDLASGAARAGRGGHSALVSNVVYSPDGHTVTTTGNDGKVIVWDPKTASPVEVLNGPVAQAGGVALSADGQTLYTYSLDGVVLAWDLAGDRSFGLRFHLGPGLPCCGPVSPPAPPLAISPDGSRFAVQLGASTVGLFSARNLQRQASFTVGPRGAVITSLAWSPTGPALAVGGYSGLVQLWNLAGAPRLTRTFVGLQAIGKTLPEAVQSVAFSPDGRLLAASDETETPPQPALAQGTRQADLAIWRASTGSLVAERVALGPVFVLSGGSNVLAFARDGRLLAASQSALGGAAQVLDPFTLQTSQALPPLGGNTVSLAFAPDGTLATGTSGGTVQLWNPTSGQQTPRLLLAALTPITSIAFDATGQHFATTSAQNGEVKLWFTSTLEQDGATLATERSATYTVAFEPPGGNLLVVDDHGNGFTWPTSPAAWEQRACATAGRNLTRKEWSTYLPEQAYTRVCP